MKSEAEVAAALAILEEAAWTISAGAAILGSNESQAMCPLAAAKDVLEWVLRGNQTVDDLLSGLKLIHEFMPIGDKKQ